MKFRAKNAFTLIELLVVIAIIAILAALLMPTLARARQKAHTVQCMSNMRQLAFVYHLYSEDYSGRLPNKDMLGNSSFRALTDPLSLPTHFKQYVPTNRIWMCPAGRRGLEKFNVNYAWSRAQNLVSENGSAAAFAKMSSTPGVWDNFTYTLPSTFNVPELLGGPKTPSAMLRYYPHSKNSKANYLYLDGHVETK